MATLKLTMIKPKRQWNVLDYSDTIDKGLFEEANKIVEVFKKSAATFSHQPKFERSKKIRHIGYDREADGGALKYYKANMIFSMLNWGAERDIVSVPPKKAMKFLPGYKPATSAHRALNPNYWAKFGEKMITTRRVHQRISARRIDIAVAHRRRPYFKRVMKNRMSKAAKRNWV